MNVLVTGGAGYIVSHTAKALYRSGFCPVVFDNLSKNHARAVKWGPLVEGDLEDTALVGKVLCEHEIQAVIHFAASAYVSESVANPRKYFGNNVRNTLNLLDAMLDERVRNIVFSSTCATYGVPDSPLICERVPQQPINPYGEAKLFIERVLRWYEKAYNLGWVALRYFNAAGADPDGDLGEDHQPETHLIPLIIQAGLALGPPVDIYGADYATADGTAIRDYVHVSDLAEAHVSALRYLLRKGAPIALNLGGGSGHSVRQVIAAFKRISGCSVPARCAPRRPGDPPVLIADTALAAKTLGWLPALAGIECIIETAWRWQTRIDLPAAQCLSMRTVG